MELYSSLGSLLRHYRKFHDLNQKAFSSTLEVTSRTYRRWEKNEVSINELSLMTISRVTKIPFEVVFRLFHGYPTLFDISSFRYSNCPFERNFINKKILQKKLFDSSEEGNIDYLSNEQNFTEVYKFNTPLINHKMMTNIETIKQASNIFPDLNIIIRDPLGFYSGHLICLPLDMDKYLLLRERKIKEYEISPNDITAIPQKNPIALHILTMYATCSTYAYCLIKRLVYALITLCPGSMHPDSVISRYSIVQEGHEFCSKMGMDLVFCGFEDTEKLNSKVIPQFFETRISDLHWLTEMKHNILKQNAQYPS